MSESFVKLISSEGHTFVIERKCALISGTIKAMLSGSFAESSGEVRDAASESVRAQRAATPAPRGTDASGDGGATERCLNAARPPAGRDRRARDSSAASPGGAAREDRARADLRTPAARRRCCRDCRRSARARPDEGCPAKPRHAPPAECDTWPHVPPPVRTIESRSHHPHRTFQVTFPEINTAILEKVCQYMHYKVRYTNSNVRIPEFQIAPEMALELLMASNYLDL